MSRLAMSFALPGSMREYIDNRVAAGNYGNTSEYIRARSASHPCGREGTDGDRPRRDRLKPTVLRPQARRDQQGQVRCCRNEAGTRVAVKLVNASNVALDQIELDPCNLAGGEVRAALVLPRTPRQP
jgi:hypothetical protein